MILIDLSHTSHTSSQSGVQQVCRQLFTELGKFAEIRAIVYDPYAKAFRFANRKEELLCSASISQPPTRKRKAKWSNSQKLRGLLHRLLPQSDPLCDSSTTAILAPEIISPHVPVSKYLELKGQTGANLYALFHDMIALKLPDRTPAKTVAYFPRYLEKLSQFDSIAAVSRSSYQDLEDYWKENKPASKPAIATIPLGSSVVRQTSASSPTETDIPRILSVGSIEGRKNHLALLNAASALWSSGWVFELELIGVSNPETARPALEQIERLQSAGRPLVWHGPAEQSYLEEQYRGCRFTVYPSTMEGFGLPPLESLSYGKPCICSNQTGLAETVEGGGCLIPDSMQADGIARAIETLLTNERAYETLQAEALKRAFRNWNDYANDINQWLANPI